MQATAAPPVVLDGYIRRFKLSGFPFWVYGGAEYEEHPNGYIRILDVSGAWYWASADENAVLDQDGNVVWDTVQLGL
ncbi:hypothetical protein V8F33_013789 [Rhypophila sp. PSN 637]